MAEETCQGPNDEPITVHVGMRIVAFEEDSADGKPDELLASGIVERAPPELACKGSRWVLRIVTRTACGIDLISPLTNLHSERDPLSTTHRSVETVRAKKKGGLRRPTTVLERPIRRVR
jgi:hypothetical protein